MDLQAFAVRSKSQAAENKKFLKSLSRKDVRVVDEAFHREHEDVFAQTNCLTCANCCKTTSPIFYPNDVERAARVLGLKPGEFAERFLRIDEDHDYVLKSLPCPFLLPDNRCHIYEYRPKACREYPHTHRKKMTQILDLTYRNTLVCPAVLQMVERLKRHPLLKPV
ncbi:MAG: Fe-S oxidoreductase [Cyclobacteriaceae bacterium]|nr:MAG: Fe-S oxidoreductase [Cyclobacteriaceae bacterium]